ncbi:AHH domain-containing protein [Archangium sp.]|uniref:AHH domain-containing protein n=1 Tax=Archangium sp. TaxID=1872627 RepID=UPI002D66FE35|nr:AHH domain-containing protein [Archangium sp.]HYO51331.1 AHH domain-containing protein [Archangium sp.]
MMLYMTAWAVPEPLFSKALAAAVTLGLLMTYTAAELYGIATNKNDKSDVSGGPWTPRYKRLFDKAGMSLDALANIVYLIGHIGPHPEEVPPGGLPKTGGCAQELSVPG